MLRSRLDRIDNKLRNIRNLMSKNRFRGAVGLGGNKVSYSLGKLTDIDKMIDNIETEDDAEKCRKLLMDNINEADRLYAATDDYMIMDNNSRRNINIYDEANSINNIYDDKVINYVAAILDPEYNYNTGIMVKQPSLMNPPSVSIPIKTLTTIPSEGFSSICIAWNPTMFCTVGNLGKIQIGIDTTDNDKPIYANKICSVLYSLGELENGVLKIPPSAWSAPVRGIPDNLPEVGIAKARLVSSKIKISFRGPVLNQGGTIMAAATFQGPPGVLANTGDDNKIKTNSVQKDATWGDLFKVSLGNSFSEKDMTPFEEKVISNGIWAKNINITKDANGISAIFIPTDPMDEIFCKPGTFYGEKVDNPDARCGGPRATSCLYSDKGARLNYLFNVQGIPGDNTNPITVETYTTWEVIPTSQSASTLRNSASTVINSEYANKIKAIVSTFMEKRTGIDKVGSEPTMNGILDWVGAIARKLIS